MKGTLVAPLALALVACGASTHGPHRPKQPDAEVLTSHEVARGEDISFLAADAHDVYWASTGVWRRPHTGGTPEQVFAGTWGVDLLALGDRDLFVVASNDVLYAVAKDGGGPSDLTQLDSQAWGLAGDGDGVWVGIDNRLERWTRDGDHRSITLPGSGYLLAIGGGHAFTLAREASGGASALWAIDLAHGTVTVRSTAPVWAQVGAMTVRGDTLVGVSPLGTVELPIASGGERVVSSTPATAVAADAGGAVILTGGALLAEGTPPRIVATGTTTRTLAEGPYLAIGGGYVYHVDYDQTASVNVLRADPRDGGAALWRLGPEVSVTALIGDGDGALAAIEDHAGDRLIRVDAHGLHDVATAPAYVGAMVSDGEHVAFVGGDGGLYAVREGAAKKIADLDAPNLRLLAVHRGLVYWTDGAVIHAVPFAGGGAQIDVGDGEQIEGAAGDLMIAGIAFTDDDLYFTLPDAGLQGLGRIDRNHRASLVWTYATETGAGAGQSLSPDLVLQDDRAYVQDGAKVLAVPLDGGPPATAFADDRAAIYGIERAGDRVLAWVRGDDGDRLVLVPRDAHEAPALVWQAGLDGGALGPSTAAEHTAYVWSAELGGMIAVPLPTSSTPR